METHDPNSRLDVHEQQIKQLQSDVREIKQLIDYDRTESAAFRKLMIDWMKQQEKKINDSSSLGTGPKVTDPFHTPLPTFDSSHFSNSSFHEKGLPWTSSSDVVDFIFIGNTNHFSYYLIVFISICDQILINTTW
ncbi:hypothetical protein E3N88_15849 [Mikania micrantha]|uniref:Uncharacterized protein n=1 Tax=Mikania micrantha TaxID=192012 RepID=A0A5N6NWR6_9ASTR|nr:hypothetical protein E3N88_15849 [Mikania micrantha]